MVDAQPLSVAGISKPQGTAAPTPARGAAHPSFFRRLLSELNPLQYVPVVGTIYRAVTGDIIPEAARFTGSLVVSGLIGGPLGLAINLGATAAEKSTGVDPEAIGARLLADIGIGGPAAVARSYARAAAPAASSKSLPTPPPARLEAGSDKPWSAAQLTAYGVMRDARGDVRRGAVSGADVLNGLELTRLAQADGKATVAAVA